MRGIDHLTVSVFFMMPVMFYGIYNSLSGNGDLLILSIIFVIAVGFGSIIPDADCNKSLLKHRHFSLYKIVDLSHSLSVKLVNDKKRHRGVMHSLFGIIITTLILSILIVFLSVIIGIINYCILITIILGLFLGQILHLAEDSLTINGVNWLYPFREYIIKGKLRSSDSQKFAKYLQCLYILTGVVSYFAISKFLLGGFIISMFANTMILFILIYYCMQRM